MSKAADTATGPSVGRGGAPSGVGLPSRGRTVSRAHIVPRPLLLPASLNGASKEVLTPGLGGRVLLAHLRPIEFWESLLVATCCGAPKNVWTPGFARAVHPAHLVARPDLLPAPFNGADKEVVTRGRGRLLEARLCAQAADLCPHILVTSSLRRRSRHQRYWRRRARCAYKSRRNSLGRSPTIWVVGHGEAQSAARAARVCTQATGLCPSTHATRHRRRRHTR